MQLVKLTSEGEAGCGRRLLGGNRRIAQVLLSHKKIPRNAMTI